MAKTKKKTFSPIQQKRLRQLALHLSDGKLGHQTFDFSMWNGGYVSAPVVEGCGTNGCAIGECPIAFPTKWKFNDGLPYLRRKKESHASSGSVYGDGMKFFGLTYPEFQHLFVSRRQSPVVFGGRQLDGDATAQEVASNIKQFLEQYVDRPWR